MSVERRQVLRCDNGHRRSQVAAFTYTADTDPGSPTVGEWAWRWDNGHTWQRAPGAEKSEGGMARWYDPRGAHQVTREAADGSWRADLHCGRCGWRAVVPWAFLVALLDTSEQVLPSSLMRYAVIKRR